MVKRRRTPAEPTAPPKPRLSRDDWIDAGIRAVMADGLDALAVEPMATRVGATKGSFYWHFRDRAELLDLVLERWEALATRAIIDQVNAVADPRDRLRALLDVVFDGREENRFELAVFAEAGHPQVRPVVERVTRQRIDFVESLFAGLGLTPASARRRARATYAMYLGVLQLQVLDAEGMPSGRRVQSFADEVFSMVAPAARTEG